MKGRLESFDLAATGTVLAKPADVYSVVLTPAAAAATLILRDGGAGGAVLLRLQAGANGNSTIWVAPADQPITSDGVDLHATIGGAGANLNVGLLRKK